MDKLSVVPEKNPCSVASDNAYKPSGPSGEAYPSFLSTKQLEYFYSPLDGMLVHHRVTL